MKVIVRCNLRRLRKAKGWSLKQLSEIVGIHHGNLSKYERNVGRMTVITALKICLALDCTLEELFEYKKSAGGV